MQRGGPLRTQVRSYNLTFGVLSKRMQLHSQGWATRTRVRWCTALQRAVLPVGQLRLNLS